MKIARFTVERVDVTTRRRFDEAPTLLEAVAPPVRASTSTHRAASGEAGVR